MHFRIIQLPTQTDERGALTVLDGVLPFEIKRLYWIYAADGQTRGGHRHEQTVQALIAIRGSVTVHMDDGEIREDVPLDMPDRVLIVDPKDWHRMTFGKDAILLVAASLAYDPDDYIHKGYRP